MKNKEFVQVGKKDYLRNCVLTDLSNYPFFPSPKIQKFSGHTPASYSKDNGMGVFFSEDKTAEASTGPSFPFRTEGTYKCPESMVYKNSRETSRHTIIEDLYNYLPKSAFWQNTKNQGGKKSTTNSSILYVLEVPLSRCLLGPYLCHCVEPYLHAPT